MVHGRDCAEPVAHTEMLVQVDDWGLLSSPYGRGASLNDMFAFQQNGFGEVCLSGPCFSPFLKTGPGGWGQVEDTGLGLLQLFLCVSSAHPCQRDAWELKQGETVSGKRGDLKLSKLCL